MCRWFSIFLLPYIVYCVSAEEQDERNSLTRPIHPRRHKRAEQVRVSPTPQSSPFVVWKNDPKCMVPGRDMMSCPKKNPDDPYEKLICIEPQALCDDQRDCHFSEDEDAHFCMFKKLEDAEMRRLRSEVLKVMQSARNLKPEFKDVVVNTDIAKVAKTPTVIQEPISYGRYKMEKGSGPVAKLNKSRNKGHDYENDNEEQSDEENNEGEEDEEEDEEAERKKQIAEELSAKARRLKEAGRNKGRRTYRHLNQLELANL